MIFEDADQSKACFCIVFQTIPGHWRLKAAIYVSADWKFAFCSFSFEKYQAEPTLRGGDLLTDAESL